MKHPIRIAGLCLLAMLAINAVGAATASAAPPLPYWDQCTKTTNAKEGWYKENLCKEKTTLAEQNEWEKVEIEPGKTCVLSQEEIGRWKDSECKLADEKHTSKWSWIAKGNHKFTSKQIGVSILESKNLGKVECKEGTNAGEKTGPQHFTVNITFKGCTAELLKVKVPCGNNLLAESKEIKTTELEGTLVYALKGATKIAGVLLTTKLKPKEEKPTEPFSVFKCGPPKGEKTITVDGGPTQKEAAEEAISGSCILGEIKPINKMTKTGELVFSQEKGVQVLKEFEYHGKKGGVCELKSQLEKEPKEQAWENTTDEVTFEDATQVVA